MVYLKADESSLCVMRCVFVRSEVCVAVRSEVCVIKVAKPEGGEIGVSCCLLRICPP